LAKALQRRVPEPQARLVGREGRWRMRRVASIVFKIKIDLAPPFFFHKALFFLSFLCENVINVTRINMEPVINKKIASVEGPVLTPLGRLAL
jgi:hypothetical protein